MGWIWTAGKHQLVTTVKASFSETPASLCHNPEYPGWGPNVRTLSWSLRASTWSIQVFQSMVMCHPIWAQWAVYLVDPLAVCLRVRGQLLVALPCTLLVLLKYPFYYTIRSCFGKFFGMIYVLTHHLAPELDRFRFCPGFWSMLHFDRNLDIFREVLTHGYN